MPPRVHLAHRTRDRVRLRIPEKRKDLPYFLSLYEELRRIPGIRDVVINPVTGSLLLHFPPQLAGPVFGSLYEIGLLRLDTDERAEPGLPGQMGRVFSGRRGDATDMRIVLLIIVVALTIHQVRRGLLLVPTLTVLWYGYDLWASHKSERSCLAATTGDPPASPGA